MSLLSIASSIAAAQILNPVESLKHPPDDWSRDIMTELHGIIPFAPKYRDDLPLSVLSWASRCEKQGLITSSEYYRLERAIKKTEGIYD